ncbi:GHKL domain-containing protein [Fulvivirga sp. RKSG066]|uniref:ATP-binding protein n=1 Tax=Fulvivirga aurantia TaxID=2529383 RepID=UPI0012BC09EB|nr:ATP-binding protein [Fulvivirga aurantia]MTI23236.1 GHKL domain-containing protein [Fulvivirga aurantia]
MTTDLLPQLKSIPELKEVPDDQLQWLIENSSCNTYQEGEFLFKKGDSMDNMHIILSGGFVIKLEQNNQFRTMGSFEPKTITGTLPYSRASTAGGYAEAKGASQVVSLSKSYFKTMIHEHEELTTALVHIMSSRIRQFTKLQQQNDKMMALGKLSAGLAHELNNPSAAVVRSARTLQKHLSFLPENFKDVIKIKASDEEVDCVNNILFSRVKEGIKDISLIEKTECEDAIAEWLEEKGVEDGYEIAENFVDFGFTEDDFKTIEGCLRPVDLLPVIGWLNQVLTTEKLVNEIQDASQRINDLVMSVKGYTHMDQAPEKKPANIHIGINNTLTMLNHKLKKNNIAIEKNFDPNLPEPALFISEMNQVWTNLIDNAIDAMKDSESRTLTIATRKDGSFVNIDIKDTGKGIPDDIMGQIFDPFFTTKPVGEGTGLGLDVVQQIINQHNGSIKVDSKPGETIFKVCLPIN